MPVPSSIADLSTTPASNSPAGSETPSSVDDYLRTQAAFIKQTYNAVQDGSLAWCGTAGGTANAITLTPSPAITAYAAGQVFRFKAASTNTGATTLAISGLTTVAVQINGAACAGGEIVSGQWYEAWLSDATTAQVRACAAPNQVGAINFKRATVAATATTTPLWSAANGNIQDWAGTPTITDFPAAPQAGAQREVYPAAGTIITHAGNISVQGGANYTVRAGDKLTIAAVTTTTFYVGVTRKDGVSVAGPSLAATAEITATGATFTNADVGSLKRFNVATSNSHTLPAANSLAAGQAISFINIGAGAVTINRAGTDTLNGCNLSAATSLRLNKGESVQLMSDGAAVWFIANSSVAFLGAPQTWQNLLVSRALNATYTNSTGRDIFVSVVVTNSSTGAIDLLVDGARRARTAPTAGSSYATLSALVPDGSTYAISVATGVWALFDWNELR
jgi:hypothetical protein